jgi:DHA1 family bicyclomycin/chloramphenicol resistance-like MFS transporter
LANLITVGRLVLLFVVVASLGFVLPNATALALAAHARAAGSASALLGVMQYAIGAAGEGTARPMALVIAALGLAAVLTFVLLGRGIAREA